MVRTVPSLDPAQIEKPYLCRRTVLQGAFAAIAWSADEAGWAEVIAGSANPLYQLGYKGDGHPHPLSAVQSVGGVNTEGWSLQRWLTLFPRATSLSEEIDRHAIQRLCDLHPQGISIHLPSGIAMIDKGIVTGGDQSIRLSGADRSLTEIHFSQAGGTLWAHGHTVPANGTFTVEDLTIRPTAICAAAFDVMFSGHQPPWCHIMRNVLLSPFDTTSYFESACITSNIKRGLDWHNVIAYGRHFHILSSNAFEFPCNRDQTTAGNSYNFDNVMTVGYAYSMNFDFYGFSATDHHMHEEVQMYNVQSYAGIGMLRALNRNYKFAAADNFTLLSCGCQGLGPALDLNYLEHVKIRDSLFVNDETSDRVSVANITDCASLLFEGNEIFSPNGRNLVGIVVAGERTRNITLQENDVVAYSTFETFLLVDKNVLPGMVQERGTHFAGSAAYALGKVVDRSSGAISQTRATEAAETFVSMQMLKGSTSISVTAGSDIDWSATFESRLVDKQGHMVLDLPPDLFRTIKTITAQPVGGTSSWVVVEEFDTKMVRIRYPQSGIARNSIIRTTIRAIGR